MLGRWRYRSRQFFAALFGRVSPAGMEEARRVLGPRLFALFASAPSAYRHHALAVYRRVRRSGCADLNVWQAALLHDMGKYDPDTGMSVTLLHRVAVVLLGAAPAGRRLLRGLQATPRRNRLLFPLYLSAHHPRLGARMAEQNGARPEVVHLIASHRSPHGADPALAALQAADDRS